MAIIKQGILGGFSGKVGGVVGTSWKGRAVMKAMPLSVANPQTTGQVSQRTSFKSISTLASDLLTQICRPVYNPIAGDISGFNKFTQQNKTAFDGSGDFVPANCKIGGGVLQHDQVSAAAFYADGVSITVSWVMPATTPVIREGDSVHAFAIEPLSGNVWASVAEATRNQEIAVLTKVKAGSDLIGQLQVYCFAAYVSADGRSVSIEASGVAEEIDFS